LDLKDITQVEYIRAVRSQVQEGKERQAFIVVQQAVIHYPKDPFILSYFGYLQAAFDKKYRTGVENCLKALKMLEQDALSGGKKIHPLVYINLGRAYLAAGKRKDAVLSLEKGFGMRKKPPVPFLNRSNPINKYLGIMLYSQKNSQTASRGR
jgi:tetratricopeptide (TPR) repeat protein